MLTTTTEALGAILRSDPTITTTDRARLIAAMRAPAATSAPTERLMRPVEAARVLSRSLRAVHLLAAQGHLKKVHLPGRTRAGGFLASDVYRLIGGAAQ